MEVIGLSGYARSGKDEAAKVLVDEFGYTRVAFADKLREVLYALNPLIDNTIYRYHENLKPNWIPYDFGKDKVYVKDVIDQYGWDGYKATPYGAEIRRLLQRLGTEAGRQTLWDSIWVDAAFAGIPEDAKVVVTDCRFPNEAEAIKQRKGKIWRITREGVGPANSHASETSLDDWKFDYHLWNNSDLESYKNDIRATMLMYRQDAEAWERIFGKNLTKIAKGSRTKNVAEEQ